MSYKSELALHLSRREFVQQAATAATSAAVAPQLGLLTLDLPPALAEGPSDLVKASPSLMASIERGMPVEEAERLAQGAENLRKALSQNEFYAQRAAREGWEYWLDFFYSRINSWPPDYYEPEAIARDQAKVTPEHIALFNRCQERPITIFDAGEMEETREEVYACYRVSIATRGFTVCLPPHLHDLLESKSRRMCEEAPERRRKRNRQ